LLFKDLNISIIGSDPLGRLKGVGRSKAFDAIGTIFAILSVIFVTVINLKVKLFFFFLISYF